MSHRTRTRATTGVSRNYNYSNKDLHAIGLIFGKFHNLNDNPPTYIIIILAKAEATLELFKSTYFWKSI